MTEQLQFYRHWQTANSRDWNTALAEDFHKVEHRAAFATICESTQNISSSHKFTKAGGVIRYRNPGWWLDLDHKEDPVKACTDALRFMSWLETKGCNPECVGIWLSGGKGLHIVVPESVFVPPEHLGRDWLNLPRIIEEMTVTEAFLETADRGVYDVQRMWRTENKIRDNGLYKVPVTLDELRSITTTEDYRALCSAPRPTPARAAPEYAAKLGDMWGACKERVERIKRNTAPRPKMTPEQLARLGGEIPETVREMLAGRCKFKLHVGWNDIAVQVAIVGHHFGMDEDGIIDASQGLIDAHRGGRYRTTGEREAELRSKYRSTDDYEFSLPAIMALLDQPAPDLLQAQEMLNLPDFSDFEALEPSELLPCCPDTGEMPQAGLEAFPGVMEAVVRAGLASETKPQAGLTILSALVGMAAAVPGCYEFMGTRSNLYGFGLAETGAGKDQPRRIAEDLAFRADVNRCALPASGQGLEDAVAETGRLLCSVDEIGHLFAATNASKAPGHLIEINGNLLRFFSASQGSYFTRAKAGKEGKSRTIQHPMLNVLGFSTPSALGAALSSANVLDGLLGRFLMVEGAAGVVPRFRVSGYHPPEAATALARRIQAAGAAGNTVHVRSSRVVDEMLENLQQILHRKGEESSDPAAKLLCVRSYEKVVRVALVLAVWDHPERPQIDERHVAWASSFVDASDRTMLAFVRGHIHDGAVQADAAKVSRTITALLERPAASLGKVAAELAPKKTVTWADVLRRSKLSAQALKMAVEHLEALGDVAVSVLPSSGKGAGAAVKVITAL